SIKTSSSEQRLEPLVEILVRHLADSPVVDKRPQRTTIPAGDLMPRLWCLEPRRLVERVHRGIYPLRVDVLVFENAVGERAHPRSVSFKALVAGKRQGGAERGV